MAQNTWVSTYTEDGEAVKTEKNVVVAGKTSLEGEVVYSKPATNSTETLEGAGAISLDTAVTFLVTTGADALTLADGERDGQIKTIVMVTDGGDGTLTPVSFANGTTATFDAVGESIVLVWDATTELWYSVGTATATIA